MPRTLLLSCLLLSLLNPLPAAEPTATALDAQTLDQWSAPYRGWHYQPNHVIPAQPKVPGHENFHSTDVPCSDGRYWTLYGCSPRIQKSFATATTGRCSTSAWAAAART